MRAAHRDVASGAFLLLLALGLHLAARAIPAKFPIGVDSGFFPEVVSAALALFALAIIVQGLRRRPNGERDCPEGQEATRDDAPASVARAGCALALIALYGAGLAVVGFLSATFVFLTLLIFQLAPPEARRWTAALAVSLPTTLVVYAVFTYGFQVVLPSGGIW